MEGTSNTRSALFDAGKTLRPRKRIIFLVQINIKETGGSGRCRRAHAATVLESARGQFRKSFSNCVGTTVHLRRAIGKAAKRRGDFKWSLACCSSPLKIIPINVNPSLRHARAAAVVGSWESR